MDAALDALLEAIEDADRGALENLLAADYHDQWNISRADAIDRTLRASRQFWSLELTPRATTRVIPAPLTATTTLLVTVKGEGTAFAPVIANRANKLATPFTLTWRREPWKPWSWKLELVSNPALKSIEP